MRETLAPARGRFAGLWQALVYGAAHVEAQSRLARRIVWGAWGATRLALLLGLLAGQSYCDPAFYHYAGLFADGHWPYRDVAVEYPPLAMALILLPALPLLPFAGLAPRPVPAFEPPLRQQLTTLPHPDPVRYGAYGLAFAVEMLLLDALTLLLVRRAARSLLGRDALGNWCGLCYVVIVFLSGTLLQKFDLATGTLCLAAIVALAEGWPGWAGAFLALAALVKGFPVLALPIFGLFILCGRGGLSASALARSLRRGPLGRCLVAFAATVAVPTMLVVVGSAVGLGLPHGVGAVWHTLTYHTSRKFEIESIWATLMLMVGWLPGLRPTATFNPEDLSRVVTSPLQTVLHPLPDVVLGLAIGAVYFATWRTFRRESASKQGTRPVVRIAALGSLAALVAFMVTFPALPAHYLLVAAPLGAVLAFGFPSRGYALAWAVSLGGIGLLGQVLASQVIWHNLTLLHPWAVALLALRNCAWMVAFGTLVLSLWRGLPAQELAGAKSSSLERS